MPDTIARFADFLNLNLSVNFQDSHKKSESILKEESLLYFNRVEISVLLFWNQECQQTSF